MTATQPFVIPIAPPPLPRVAMVGASYSDAVSVVMGLRDVDFTEIMAQRPMHAWPQQIAEDVTADGGVCSCALLDGFPVAIVGAYPSLPGTWAVFMFATHDWPHVALSVTRFIKRELIPHLLAVGANRAECRAIEDNTKAHAWLERLGAVHEATMPDCGEDRKTFRLYAWRRSDFEGAADV